jgi:hypothetical protein
MAAVMKLALAVLLFLAVVVVSEPIVTIDPAALVFVLDPEDSGFGASAKPLAMALRDVKLDFYKVLGTPPPVILSTETGATALPPGFKGTAFFFGKAARRSFSKLPEHLEAHAIAIDTTSSPGVNIVGAVGREGRGEVFAAYSVCERILGVEPLWWWTDTEPNFQGKLSLNQSQVSFESGAPRFEWRGFFANDEDLLGNFKADPLGEAVFSADTWNRVCEALLRLKGNLVIGGTVAYPDESVYRVAHRRGVAVTMQHFTLLGVNTWRWPVGIPYSFDQNSEIQEFVWNACVAEYKNREAVWTIGYRGLNDYAFWIDEPKFNTTESRCALINAAMAKQAEIVRKTPGREADQCVTYLWSEMLELFLSGDLILPANTTRVFADQGGSGTFDPRVYPLLSEGDGAYYHVQMESPYKMSQLTEMVPPRTFFNEVAKFVAKKATSYFMLNLSDLRPATFLVDTVMRFLWTPDAMMKLGPDDAQAAAIEQWSQRFYSGSSSGDGGRSAVVATDDSFASRAAAIMKDYFAIDYILAANTSRYGDEHLSGLVRKLLTGDEPAATAAAWVAHPLGVQLRPLHTTAVALYDDMVAAKADGAPFFQSSFLLYVATHRYGCEAINATAHAMLQLGTVVGRRDYHTLPAQRAEEAQRYLGGALDALEALRALQREAEQLKWRGWYAGDQLVDFANVACLLLDAKQQLAAVVAASGSVSVSADSSTYAAPPVYPTAPAQCNLMNGFPWHRGTGPWSSWFTYSNTSTNFPYLNPPPVEWSMDYIVRVTCQEGEQQSSCVNTPVGGKFNSSAVIVMAAPGVAANARDGATIRYTLDGSEPTVASSVFTGPITIHTTTKVAARVFDGSISDSKTSSAQALSHHADNSYIYLVTRPTFTSITSSPRWE